MVLRFHSNKRTEVKGTPPRRTIGTTHGSVAGLLVFHGTDAIAYESTLERDFLIRLEMDRRAVRVISQPLTLEYADGTGCQRVYTPDFRVDYGAGYVLRPPAPSALIEVKPRDKLARHLHEWRPRYRAAMRFCHEHGWVFHFADEGRIRDQRWKNAMFLRRYRKMRFDPEESDRIVEKLTHDGPISVGPLLMRDGVSMHNKALGVAHLWHLVATARVVCDLDVPLSDQTKLRVPGHD